ncbi:RNA-directed DNA polymerase from mobile element jockey [Trichonephila clavipes]|nr:RNA-directed DNA polymerase from mobile element jockey [Trichonephila clavipes]
MTVVIPILKPNSDDSNPQNYRPISLLSSLSKAYEFVILNRLNQHCLAKNIIISEQHGFVTKCSTVTQLLRVTELFTQVPKSSGHWYAICGHCQCL